MDEFGTLDDWKEMVDGMHKRGIKLIMDLVSNHSSDEHMWFKEARKSKDNPYRDYYIWQKGRKGNKKPPNNWTSRFGGPAWTYDKATDEWYLHLFTRKQPDLNWDNPKVRQEIADICNYWFDLGCDGFRCDVITYISKEEGYPKGKFGIGLVGDEKFTHGPNIHKYLKELNQKSFSQYDSMTVGECPGVTTEEGLMYTGEDRDELDTVFTFEHVEADTYFKLLPRKFKLSKLKQIFKHWQHGLRGKAWNSLYYENHDQPRSIPRFVGDYGDNHKAAAKMLAVSLHMMQGTPYVFQGQEIGMTNCRFDHIDEYKDVLVAYVLKVFGKLKNLATPIIMKVLAKRARDHGRTPMQWSTEKNAGFTTAEPWIKVNPNYPLINVADNLADPDSIFNFYKKLIAFRKGNEIIKHGTFKLNLEKSEDIFCYERWWHGEKLYVICNFKNKEIPFKLPLDCAYTSAELVLHNYGYDRKLESMVLKPYEALVFKVV
jgi:oligo-1,6-glucosidase